MYDNFKPQLAEDMVKLKAPLDFTNKVASLKLDGIRVCTLNGGVYTRSMKLLANDHIRDVLSEFSFLDGEIIVGEPNAPDVYSKTQSACNTIAGTPDFRFYVFDDLSDLTLDFNQRTRKLWDRELPSYIVKHEQKRVNSQAELDRLYDQAMDQGYEGLILRNVHSMYKFGRCTAKSQDMLKAKPFDYGEALILEVIEAMHNGNEAFTNELGYTERSSHQENKVGKGMIGGFKVRDLKTGVEFFVGAGILKHAERTALWAVRETLINKILRYKYMPYGIKGETGIPRFPRFYGWVDPRDMS